MILCAIMTVTVPVTVIVTVTVPVIVTVIVLGTGTGILLCVAGTGTGIGTGPSLNGMSFAAATKETAGQETGVLLHAHKALRSSSRSSVQERARLRGNSSVR